MVWNFRATRRRRVTAEDVDRIYARAVEKIRRAIREKISTLPHGNPKRAWLESLHDIPPEALFDELMAGAYPNPERIGCPPRDVLITLARRERPIGDPAYAHLTRCSPCYLEGRAIQEADALQPRDRSC